MATEYPPLGRSYVISYSNNDRDFPIIGIRKDPRVDSYKIPQDLSPHPDSKRYPNHVFTGAQATNSDERVQWVYEILPAPWVPFTRYDDDLGPIQGRRRSVVNTGQEALLASDKKISYEGREGSAIVSIESEETWSIKTDEDGNSLFPIKDRDFYDPSKGPVQERRQIFVPTGEESASLENIDGVITETSYEAYNESLSIKIVQTYKVNGPLLVGKTTNNEGQLVTVTRQRKGAKNYTPPSLTATRTVEANREDAESLVEQLVDAPSVFSGEVRSAEKPDNVPQKFRPTKPLITEEKSITGTVVTPTFEPIQGKVELSKSEQQITEFVKRTKTSSRDISKETILKGYQFVSELGGGTANVEEIYPYRGRATDPENGTLEEVIENLGDGTKLKRKVSLEKKNYARTESAFWTDGGKLYYGESLPILSGQDYDEELDIVIPYKQVVADPSDTVLAQGDRRRVTPRDVAHSVVVKYNIEDIQDSLDQYYWETPDMVNIRLPDKLLSVGVAVNGSSGTASSEAPNGRTNTYSTSSAQRGSVGGTLYYDIEEGFNGVIPTIHAIFFLPKEAASPDDVLNRVRDKRRDSDIRFWPNARPRSYQIAIVETSSYIETSNSISFDSESSSTSSGGAVSTKIATIPPTIHSDLSIEQTGTIKASDGSLSITPSDLNSTDIERFAVGLYLYQINATPYKFSYVRVDALLVNLKEEYV